MRYPDPDSMDPDRDSMTAQGACNSPESNTFLGLNLGAVLRIRIGFSVDRDTNPDPAFFVNAEPDPEPATGEVFITQLHFKT